ncbi:MAG: TolC family protein [Flavobacterium sp.]|nr:MAG: TolC family protein [Flavobacterium sp.]
MNKSSVFTVLVLIFSLTSTAQVVEKLTREEAISETLENNFGIKMAKNDLRIADNNQGILNSGYLPSITGLAGANYSIEDQEVTFRDGTTNVVEDAETKRYDASVNLSYTLFDGLGRWYDYKRLKEEYNLSELEVRQTIENTLLQMFTVYFEVARLTENVEVLKSTYENTKNRLTRAEYRFEYGQTNRLEVLNAQVDLVTDSINLINARQTLRNTKRDLNVVLNQSIERNFEVDTTVSFIEELKMQTYLKEADTNNVRLQLARSNIEVSSLNYKASKSVYLPTVSLSGSYGWNEGQFPVTSFATGNTSTGLSAGVSLSWSLFDGGSGITTVKNSKILIENQTLLKEQLQVEVARDIANAVGNYRNRLEIYRLQQQNVETANNNYERSLERYKLGQITSVELRQAQINLLNNRTTRNLAKYQAKIAELELLQQTGQLLNVAF